MDDMAQNDHVGSDYKQIKCRHKIKKMQLLALDNDIRHLAHKI